MRYILFFLFGALLVYADNIEITAENFKADEKAGFSVFTGAVNVINGPNELNASKVTVYFDADKNAKRYEARGAVSFQIDQNSSRYKGSCGRLIYFPPKAQYEFYEDVKLYDIANDRFISGGEVHVNVNTGRAKVIGSQNKPVKFIFETKENNATENN